MGQAPSFRIDKIDLGTGRPLVQFLLLQQNRFERTRQKVCPDQGVDSLLSGFNLVPIPRLLIGLLLRRSGNGLNPSMSSRRNSSLFQSTKSKPPHFMERQRSWTVFIGTSL